MRGYRRLVPFLLLLVLVLSLVQVVQAKTKITVMHWANPPRYEQVFAAAREALAKTNPDIELEVLYVQRNSYVDKVQTMIVGGIAPDLVLVSPADYYGWQKDGVISDLSKLVGADRSFSLDTMFPFATQGWSTAGKYYALPAFVNTYSLFYNKDLFDKYGMRSPDDSWSWKGEFATAVKKLTIDTSGDGAADIWGQLFDTNLLRLHTYLLGQGTDILSPDMKRCMIDDLPAVNMLQFMADLPRTTSSKAFVEGKAAMYYHGTWQMETFRTSTTVWDVAPIPRGDARRAVTESMNALAIPSASQHPTEAWQVLRTLLSTDVWGAVFQEFMIPPFKAAAKDRRFFDVMANTFKFKQSQSMIVLDALSYTYPLPRMTRFDEIMAVISKALAPLWKNEQPASIVAAQAAQQVNAILAGTK